MLITTVNIQAAGLPRATLLLQWLDRRGDHLVVLTETSAGPGTAHLLAQCEAAGWTVLANRSVPGDRGCAIISRVPVTPLPAVTASLTLPGRAVACQIGTNPKLTVAGIYVPSSDRSPDKVGKKRDFLTGVLAMLNAMPPDQRADLVLCGDYNVITRDHLPAYPGTFLGFEYQFLDTLTGELGLTDAYRHLNPGEQPHSWIGRSGNGYCFDYVHTSAGATGRILACHYDHQPRKSGLTDHAAITLKLDLATDHLPVANGSLVSAGALF